MASFAVASFAVASFIKWLFNRKRPAQANYKIKGSLGVGNPRF